MRASVPARVMMAQCRESDHGADAGHDTDEGRQPCLVPHSDWQSLVQGSPAVPRVYHTPYRWRIDSGATEWVERRNDQTKILDGSSQAALMNEEDSAQSLISRLMGSKDGE